MHDYTAPVYPVNVQVLSTRDLLASFIDPAHLLNDLRASPISI